MAMEAVGLGGGAAAAATQVGLLTQALSELAGRLPTQKIQQMESAIYDMQAATGISVTAAKQLTESINKLADSTHQYTRTELVATISQLRTLPSLLTQNSREFEKLFTTITNFSRANAPAYMRSLVELSAQYPQLTKNIMENKNAFTTLYSVMKLQGVGGLEAASKAYDAFSGKVEDAGKQLRGFRDLFKDIFTGMERISTGVTGRGVQAGGGLMGLASSLQEHNIISLAGLGVTAYGALKGYQRFFGKKGPAGSPDLGMMGAGPEELQPFLQLNSGNWSQRNLPTRFGGSRWMGGLAGRVAIGTAGLGIMNASDVAAAGAGGYTSTTAAGSIGGMAAMGSAFGPWGVIIGLLAGIGMTAKKHFELDLSKSEKEGEGITQRYVEDIIRGKYVSRASSGLQAAGISGPMANLLGEIGVLSGESGNTALVEQNISPTERVRMVAAAQQQIEQRISVKEATIGVGMGRFGAAAQMQRGAGERKAGLDEALDTIRELVPEQREYVNWLTRQYEKDTTNVEIQQQLLSSRTKLYNLEQNELNVKIERGTVEHNVNRERLEAESAYIDAKTNYLYGSSGPEKELEMLKANGAVLQNNVDRLNKIADIQLRNGSHAYELAQRAYETEKRNLDLIKLRQDLTAHDVVLAQRQHEIDLLEIEKDLQLTLYRNSVAAANVITKQIPAAMAQLTERQAQLKILSDKGITSGPAFRAAQKEVAQSALNVARMVDYQRRSMMESMTSMALGMPSGSYVLPTELNSIQKYGPAWMAVPGFKSGTAQAAPARTSVQEQFRTWAEQVMAVVSQMGDWSNRGTPENPMIVVDKVQQAMPSIR